MKTSIFLFLFIPLASLSSAKSPMPESDPAGISNTESYLRQNHLFDDWFGLGASMRENGVDINGSMTAEFAGNPTGGFSQGVAACSSLELQMVLDLQKWLPWEGTQFVTSMIWRVGESLTNNRIGNFFSVTQVFGGSTIRLYEFYLSQKLLDDQLLLKAGRMGAFDDFLSSPAYGSYVNNGFCGNPVGVFLNVPSFGQIVYPTSAWGFFAKWQAPKGTWYAQSGVYLPDSLNGSNDRNGLNWTFDNDQGVTVLMQSGLAPNSNPEDPGLPGAYSIGGWLAFDHQPTFSNGADKRTNSGLYLMLQQTLWADAESRSSKRARNTFGPGAMTGLTAFSAIVVAPDHEINAFPFFMNNGLIWQGMIPGREDDFAAMGVTYGAVGKGLRRSQRAAGVPVQSYEAVFEINYRIQLTPFFYFQPDLQYVFNPGGAGRIDDALVLAAQAGVVF